MIPEGEFSGQEILGGIRLLNKHCKLLLGAYILKRVCLKSPHEVSEVSEPERGGAMSKCGKLILGAYLIKRLREGRYYGTREHEESTGGLLRKYGKLMLTTYAIKRLRSRKSQKETEQPEEYMEPSVEGRSSLPRMAKKYGKWLLGVYLMKRFHHKEEPEAEVAEALETEAEEEGEGSSMIIFKIIMGALAGITAIYAIKKYRAKCCGQNTDVE